MARQEKAGKSRIRTSTPSGQAYTLVDRGSRGFQLEASIKGYGRVREIVGHGSREAATRRAVERIENIRQYELRPNAPDITRVAAELILAKEAENRSRSYFAAMDGHLRNYILPHYGFHTTISSIKQIEHNVFKKLLGEGDIDPRTSNRVLTTLRQVFRYAHGQGYCEPHLFPKNYPENPSELAEKWQFLAPAEIEVLLAHMPEEIRAVIGYVANTGLRIGSALATELGWIDWTRRQVRYPASVMKGKRPHTVDLNEAAVEFLGEALGRSSVKPFPYTYWYVIKRWPAARDEAGFPGLRIHDLRHSFISNQLDAGTPIHVVRDLAAHRSLAMTALYAHDTDEARKAAAGRVQVRVGAKREAAEGEGESRVQGEGGSDTKFDTGDGVASATPIANISISNGKRVGHEGFEPSTNGLRTGILGNLLDIPLNTLIEKHAFFTRFFHYCTCIEKQPVARYS